MLIVFACKEEELIPADLVVLTSTIVNISPQGTIFAGKILANNDLTSVEKGFVWDTISNPSIEKSHYVSTGKLTNGEFSEQIDFDLISGKKYYVRAFIQTEKNIIYGNEAIFISKGSKGPIIESFTPEIGTRGDTILIRGNYFSARKTNNIVKVGRYKCSVIEATKDELKVVVTDYVDESGDTKLSVEVFGVGSVQSNLDFQLDGPIITKIYPLSGPCYYSVITIEGTGFSDRNYGNVVYATHTTTNRKYEAKIIEYNENILKILFPNMIPGIYNISVRSNWITYKSNIQYELEATEITNISPMAGPSNSDIVITGKNLKGALYHFGGNPYGVINNHEEAIMQIPYLVEEGEYQISFQNGCQFIEYPQKFTVTTPWKLMSEFPGIASSHAYSFNIGRELYILMGQQRCGEYQGINELWSYNLDSKEWKRKADFPASYRWGAAYCTLDNKLYFGTGKNYFNNQEVFNDFWEYNTLTDDWKLLTPFKGSARSRAVCFTLDNRIFLGSGEELSGVATLDMYEYHNSTDSWTQIADVPAPNNYNPLFREFMFNDKLYLHGFQGIAIGNPNMFEFDITTTSWNSWKVDLSANYDFILYNNKRNYFVSNSQLFIYNPVNQERKNLASHPSVIRTNDITGTLTENTIILGLGYNYNDCPQEFYYLELQ